MEKFFYKTQSENFEKKPETNVFGAVLSGNRSSSERRKKNHLISAKDLKQKIQEWSYKFLSMNYHFQAHRQVRRNLLEILQNTSHKDLMHIPDGFNNNIYWNIAHCVATQQLLCYYLSGNPFRIDKYWIETYKKGTLPNLNVQQSEIDDLAFLLTETSKILMKDYDADFFSDYTSYTTSFGMDLKNIQDAIIFNNMHESLHYGYVMALKRAILGEKY